MRPSHSNHALLSLAVALLLGCQRPPTASSARSLRFGSGGGFAGLQTTYELYPDGRLTRRTSTPAAADAPATPLPPPPAAQVRACFRQLDALPTDSLQLDQPGNLTYFLDGQTRRGCPVHLAWGAPGAPAPHAARALYRNLQALLPR
ncbi:hypothetical protein LJ737_17465 [Hymenobacter sp. 15J16-1T3B]|uniref:hypothetical protein n=1 Tax=Hymenobacter sp. 15J16-1T3B TaxID=2886941 RepID=UPI001D11A4C6|nr:hypothetical protein [Hymenobacter sp. 15J16-1T3B]MCC3159036.1 hypothetical protein [Hymenobacter sp. 15J16-1T3B]